MQIQKNSPSIFGKSLNWIANNTYRQIPIFINSYQRKPTSSKKLSFQDYILSPQLARQAGLMYVRQLRKDYIKQKEGIEKVITEYKSNKDQLKEKPHELLCPICLQLFNGPVTTSCNHTFCRMCLDESILFNPNCPACRKSIRAQQLIVSKSTEAIIRMLLYKLDTEQVQKFVKKELQYQEWLEKRTPKRHQLHKGQRIDVRDTQHIWCHASIVAILPENVTDPQKYEYLLVHYEGWASRFDEVISLESLRLATKGFYMSRYDIPHYNLDPNNAQHFRSQVITGPPRQPQPPLNLMQENEQNNIQSQSSNSMISLHEADFYVQPLPQDNRSFTSSQISDEQDILAFGHNRLIQRQRNVQQRSFPNDMSNSSIESYHHFQNQRNLQQSFLSSPIPLSEPALYDFNINDLWQQGMMQFQLQQMSMGHNFVQIHNNQNHDHSLPSLRQLSELVQSQFGERIRENHNIKYEQERLFNLISEIDQNIVDQINLQQNQQYFLQQQNEHRNENEQHFPKEEQHQNENVKSQILVPQIQKSQNEKENPQFVTNQKKVQQLPNQQENQIQRHEINQVLNIDL